MIRKAIQVISLLLITQYAFAFGVGEIRVDSALSRPLAARIALFLEGHADIDDINVSLAGPEAFQRAGIERHHILANLRFNPVSGTDGTAYIHVTSSQPIREPYLEFILEVTWPDGNLTRDYSILLDPPTYRQPEIVTGTEHPQRSSATTDTRAYPTNTRYGPVKPNETMWEIARELRPDTTISVERMMIALQRKNPDAFLHGNLNQIKQGAMLEMPGEDGLREVTDQEARALFLQQTRGWRAARSGRLQGSPVTDEALADQSQERPAGSKLEPEVVEQLRVIETRDKSLLGLNRGKVGGYPSNKGEKLKEAIADSRQELASVHEMNRDLEQLSGVLEQKIIAMRSSLKEKDKAIDDIRNRIKASKADETARKPAAPTGGTEVHEKPGETTSAGSPDQEVVVKLPQLDKAAVTPRGEDSFPHLSYTMLSVILAALLLLLAIFLVLRAKRQTRILNESSTYSFIDDFSDDGDEISSQAETIFRDELKKEDAPGDARLTDSNETETILGEADIYLAYRRYTQAESLIRDAIRQNQKNMELKAKMLEIYAFKKDKENFKTYLEKSAGAIAAASPEIWKEVVTMGQDLIPDHPLINGDMQPDTRPGPEFSDNSFLDSENFGIQVEITDDDHSKM